MSKNSQILLAFRPRQNYTRPCLLVEHLDRRGGDMFTLRKHVVLPRFAALLVFQFMLAAVVAQAGVTVQERLARFTPKEFQ